MGRRRGGLDLVGVGALNVDHIVGRSLLSELAPIGLPGGWSERLGDPCAFLERTEEMAELLDRLGPLAARSPGGSAFNVVQGMLAARPSLRLGLVGVLPERVPAFDSWLQARRIDTGFVLRVPGETPGLCLSLPGSEGQLFKLHPDANRRFVATVGAISSAVATDLSRARILYLSPLYDDAAARCLLKLVDAVGARAVRPLICFDPGPCWSQRPSAAVRALCRSCDLLFANEAEWCGLNRVFDGRARQWPTVIVKRRRATTILRWRHRGWDKASYPIVNPLATGDIEDATGAGDVFAAGFLTGMLAGLAAPDCVDLGHRLMRAKLLGIGTARHQVFAKLCRAQLPAWRGHDGDVGAAAAGSRRSLPRARLGRART